MSYRLKGVEMVSVPLLQYSLGRRREKKVIQARSAIALSLGEPMLSTESVQWRMETGRGWNLPGKDLLYCIYQTVVPGESRLRPCC